MRRYGKILALSAALCLAGGAGIAQAGAGSVHSELKNAPAARALLSGGGTTLGGYVAITPCRLADTRNAGGYIQRAQTRAFHVSGSTLSGQGGSATGCGIPAGASAAALSVTTTQAVANGFLTFFPTGAAKPQSVGASFNPSANATTLVNATLGTGGQISIYSSNKLHVVIDVNGYYRSPIAAYVSSTGGLGSHSNQVTSSSQSSTGNYVVSFDQDVSGCAVIAQAGASYYNIGGYTSGSAAYLFSRDVTTANSPYGNSDFYLQVIC